VGSELFDVLVVLEKRAEVRQILQVFAELLRIRPRGQGQDAESDQELPGRRDLPQVAFAKREKTLHRQLDEAVAQAQSFDLC